MAVLGTRIARFEKAKTMTDYWTKKVVTIAVVTVLTLREPWRRNIYQLY